MMEVATHCSNGTTVVAFHDEYGVEWEEETRRATNKDIQALYNLHFNDVDDEVSDDDDGAPTPSSLQLVFSDCGLLSCEALEFEVSS